MMQIIIPMSGYGERFKRAGYKTPKPLITVNNKTIIEHVINMFPGENNIIFICNKDHLKNKKYNMKNILKKIAPNCKIVSISPHKLGPVYAVLKAKNFINLKLPTIVNYCDFTCNWDYRKFKKLVLNSKLNIDGAIPCYKNFHPHTLWNNYYAYVKLKNNLITNIREKKPFTKFPRNEFASSGTYFFKNGRLMLNSFKETVKQKLKVKNEYYVSMAYKPLIENNNKIIVYELKYFMQWGTPIDLKDYLYWSNTFKSLLKKKKNLSLPGYNVIPMAGEGKRFLNEGYKTLKPLIEVSGKKMITQVLNDLPNTKKNIIVVRKDLTNLSLLKKSINNTQLIKINKSTSGQASTCLIGSKHLHDDATVTFAACDNGMIYNENKFLKLFNNKNVDIIVWGIRGYPGAYRQPKMYGWINTFDNTNKIKNVFVKKIPKNKFIDPIIMGTITFKKLKFFKNSFINLKKNKHKINNEYYLDSCINEAVKLNYNCYFFEVDHYLCWGTPNDLKTFEYWQSCFNTWKSHPYKLNKDKRFKENIFS